MAKKNYEFTIEEGSDNKAFTKVITDLLNEGWELHGDLKVFAHDKETGGKEVIWYVQALTKETVADRKSNGGGVAFR